MAPADLPIALGLLAANGRIDAVRLAGPEFAGELSLAGECARYAVRGALAMGLALRHGGAARALVPPEACAQKTGMAAPDLPYIKSLHGPRRPLEIAMACRPEPAAKQRGGTGIGHGMSLAGHSSCSRDRAGARHHSAASKAMVSGGSCRAAARSRWPGMARPVPGRTPRRPARGAVRLGWPDRGYHWVLRVARTIADLDRSPVIEAPHMTEAVQLRRGLSPQG